MEEAEITNAHPVQEKELQRALHKINRQEEYWRLKSRSLWLKSGDKNTSYFHKQAKSRKTRNRVVEIQKDNGDVTTGFAELKAKAFPHFKGLYSQEGVLDTEVANPLIQPIPKLVQEEENWVSVER